MGERKNGLSGVSYLEVQKETMQKLRVFVKETIILDKEFSMRVHD